MADPTETMLLPVEIGEPEAGTNPQIAALVFIRRVHAAIGDGVGVLRVVAEVVKHRRTRIHHIHAGGEITHPDIAGAVFEHGRGHMIARSIRHPLLIAETGKATAGFVQQADRLAIADPDPPLLIFQHIPDISGFFVCIVGVPDKVIALAIIAVQTLAIGAQPEPIAPVDIEVAHVVAT